MSIRITLSDPCTAPPQPEPPAGASALPSRPAEPGPRVLVDSQRDHRVRWSPGERLHQLFEQCVDRWIACGDPGHLAVDGEELVLSYPALDRRANQLARHLLGQGLQAGDRVGLLIDKSASGYVAMLALLKIHAAYVPLDATFPADRIAYIAGDADLRAILSLAKYQALAGAAGVPVICLDSAAADIARAPDGRLGEAETGAPRSELCYVIYTSGSTGRPKGVPIEHASICNFVRVAAEEYGYRRTDRVYQGLSLAFDFAVEEIWVPLVVGATLVPNQTGGSLLGRELSDFLGAQHITALCCVPTLLATLEGELPDLRLLIVSGEACPQDLAARWHRPGRTLLNAYGPTETTVTATLARLQPGEPVSIGRPLPTYAIVILSEAADRALPAGEVGEIGIAGIGVARGYLNREEQTRRAFIADFLGIPNNTSGRIYRTGDLGRINAQGLLEYRGRIDTQVKVRGYRIELTEIESVILQLPQVAQAVVNTWEPRPGAVELVAYYTLRDEARTLPPEALARELKQRLPPYMVPAYCERLQHIPLLTSDKADRRALPPPTGGRLHVGGGSYVAPQAGPEREIAAVLGELLGLEKVSAADDFFADLGAHSLLMAQAAARLRERLRQPALSMKDFYQHPTVRRLAAHLPADTPAAPEPPARDAAAAQRAADFQSTDPAYYACGFAQVGLALLFVFGHAFVLHEGWTWTLAAEDSGSAYRRAVAVSVLWFGFAAALPVAVKWLWVGRWRSEEFPVWSARYLRLWAMRHLTRLSPMVVFAGSPLYIAYLKALGVRVSWSAAVFSPRLPVCTDLVSIGDHAVVSRDVLLSGYRVEAHRVRTGPIHIGAGVYVGEATVLDVDTLLEPGSQLGHSSSLQAGQRLAAGRCYHGSPAEPTATRYSRLPNRPLGVARRIAYSTLELAVLWLVSLPLPLWAAYGWMHRPSSEAASPGPAVWQIAATTSAVYLGALLAGLVLATALPRLLNRCLQPGRAYPLYGLHYLAYRVVYASTNSRFYNTLFGDSSYIVYYLRALGYRFRDLLQTGSNWGLKQKQGHPLLCEVGRGTMISDGLTLLNAEFSSAAFRLGRVTIGPDNFIGNDTLYPAGGRAGANCLIATKAMVPIEGPLHENTGLLGSPCFEIPRSVNRDRQFDHHREPAELRRRLFKKNLANALSILLFLLSRCSAWNLSVLGWYFAMRHIEHHGPLFLTGFAVCNWAGWLVYFALVDRASLGFRRLQPLYCSIYDARYWRHERFWKLGVGSADPATRLLDGTPMKSWLWRLLGVQVGRRLFDDGCYIPEKSLVRLGDHCTLGADSVIQGHSLEDGIFKSERVVIGDRCTIGSKAFVHYGVRLDDDVSLAPDAFLMKGEHVGAGSRWHGNPARPCQP
ncbi:amino acid adenylation domain-containing protein [Aquabacterium sp. A7-Y]|uniref:Pls/PosA family non-ribosomal peptide synthetase n=1 Tax=Aquabacterium sp. A7-Y TaxID=1349605 RepID=UPI00223DF096|nr:Pls/PosA family non-ribosomal peptide synthetase [Aquabacterium sp. A7-Y]MCW7537585.1 amino acid adenylation domain-containing protein [Aquabacterium sp. A7-Y]